MIDLFPEEIGDLDDTDNDSLDTRIDISIELDESFVPGLDQSLHFTDPLEYDTAMNDIPDHLDTYDPTNEYIDVVGEPDMHLDNWHHQTGNTCAVVAQIFILKHHFPDMEFDEATIRDLAVSQGWYDNGTAPEDVGKILELYGLSVEHETYTSIEDLESILEDGNEIIVGVHAESIWYDDTEIRLDQQISSIPGIPGQQEYPPNHAVQVIGVVTEPDGEKFVVLNDPGVPYGQSMKVPAEQFEAAWDGTTISTTGEVVEPAPDGWSAWPLFGGFYNPDGTFHWLDDNTDRHFETGVIIHR